MKVFEIVLMVKGQSVTTYKEAESEEAIKGILTSSPKIPLVVSCRVVSNTLESILA
jgi:hypothetical protein